MLKCEINYKIIFPFFLLVFIISGCSKQDNFVNTNKLYIAPFFRSDQDTSVDLYATSNGKDFKLLNDTGNPLFKGRDSSVLYKNGYFYVTSTQDIEVPGYEFKIMRSKNLRDWETFKIHLNLLTVENNKAWAPEWFLDDDGSLYILFSLQVGMEIINGTSYVNMRPYIVKVNDLTNMKFGKPRRLVLGTEDRNWIDGFIYKNQKTYYLFIKKEPEGKIQIWSSPNMVSWKKRVDSIRSIDNYIFEAPSVAFIDDKFYLYLDNCGRELGGGMFYLTSKNLINFSKPKKISTVNPTRHGTVYKVTSKKAKKILLQYMNNK